MLLKYIVSNYKAIGHKVEFSMFPTEQNKDERFLTTIKTKTGEWKILRRGALFGPNAAGKSTLIESINFARNYIVEEKKSGKITNIKQFKGDFKDLNGITTFQFMFYLDGDVYDYGFSLDRQQVYEEWLMLLTTTGFVPMFTRITKTEKTIIEIEELAIVNSKDRKIADVLKDSMQEKQKNQLFLYKLYNNGVKKIEKIFEWFEGIQVIFPHTKIQMLPIKLMADESLNEFLSNSLSKLDTGVFKISAEQQEVDFKELVEKMNIPEDVVQEIENIKSGIVNINGKCFVFTEEKNQTLFMQLKFEHHLNNQTVKFNIEDESDGTQRLLDLLPILFKINEKNRICFVDELDRSLHTKLSKYFLDCFIIDSEKSLNQIVFTAHDVNLINLQDFRQDEIWFIEKNKLGEVQVKPFSDFEVKENQDMLKDYLNGRFGAIPVIRRDR